MAIDESCTRDWMTIWQSELSALATDREMHEGWVRAWASVPAPGPAPASVPGSAPGGAVDGPAGRAAPDAPARAAAPGDAFAALERRVAELERLLAERA